MAKTSFEVRVYQTEIRRNPKGRPTSYRVLWQVAGERFKEPFKKAAQADAFRSSLVAAAKTGEAFDVETGRPVSWQRDERPDMSWYAFACKFTDMKWPDISAKHRFGVAYMLSLATFAMLQAEPPYKAQEVRTALRRWAFNTKDRENAPEKMAEILEWVARNCDPVSSLAKAATARALLNTATSKLDGTRAAPSTCRKHVYVLNSAMTYAIELELLEANPLKALNWQPPTKTTFQVDRRSVVNPHQAKRLLAAVEARKPSGKLLKPFFATLYYAGLRPEEAVNIREHELTLPDNDGEWGELYLTTATPDVGRAWTDSGEQRDERGLKHRPRGEGRPVPLAPELVKILKRHLKKKGAGPGGLVFTGIQGGMLATSTILRIWGLAREDAFTDEEKASPLAKHPYDLRHACLSTWLNAGVSAKQVAEWAGNSPEVLLKTYARCLTGQDTIDKARISAVLGDTAWERIGNSQPQKPVENRDEPDAAA